MNMLVQTGFGRMAIVAKFGARTPEWKQFCKTLSRTTDLFLMAALLRDVFDMVTDPDMYRNLHCNQLYLVNHSVEQDALVAFRGSVLSRHMWLAKHYGKKVSNDEYQFASMQAKLLYDVCRRTIGVIDKQIDTLELRRRFIGKTYSLATPQNGHKVGTEVLCFGVLSDSALYVRPVVKTGNDSGFQVSLKELTLIEAPS